MSTRSSIAIYDPNNGGFPIKSAYIHFDGYLEGVGRDLIENYNDWDKINEVIIRGEMSSLGEDISTTRFYSRDMGEEIYLSAFETIDHWVRKESLRGVEFFYFFDDLNSKWLVYNDHISENDFLNLHSLLKHKTPLKETPYNKNMLKHKYTPNNVKGEIIQLLSEVDGAVTTDYINEKLNIKSAGSRLSEIQRECNVEFHRVKIFDNCNRGRPTVAYSL